MIKHTRVSWNSTEDATLRRERRRGRTYGQIGVKLGRTLSSVAHRVVVLGLVRIPRWSPAEDRELRQRWRAREEAADIGKEMGRTVAAVFTRAGTLGLPRRRYGKKPK